MTLSTSGLHHVTAFCGDPQQNLDFYNGILGLRLVKVTVNYDDPGTYHTYYGDYEAHPGTLITFFPWPEQYRGKQGHGQAGRLAFSIRSESYDFWINRLSESKVPFLEAARFDQTEKAILFDDPDGMQIELTADSNEERPGWDGTVPQEHSVRGFHHIELNLSRLDPTSGFLNSAFGAAQLRSEESRTRMTFGEGDPGQIIDLIDMPNENRGRYGVGTIHHVAFRVKDDEAQLQWLDELPKHGVSPTPVQERDYFRSIYYREPGGILFEMATDGPGFTINEELEHLGEKLQLPDSVEPYRDQLKERLTPFSLPNGVRFP